MNYIITNGGIHIVAQGKPYTVAKTDPKYERVVEAIKKKASDAEVVEILTGEITRIAQKIQLTTHLSLRGGTAYYKDERLDSLLSARLKQMVEEGFDLKPMEAFMENLSLNPSNTVYQQLYSYLEATKSPLTEDGCFLGYAVVNDAYFAENLAAGAHIPGRFIEVPRYKVRESFEVLCNVALRVRGFEAAKAAMPADGHIVVCKVNPRDVVAVFTQQQILRVCAYKVMYDLEGYFEDAGVENRIIDILSERTVATEEAPFAVETYDFDNKIVGRRLYGSLSSACKAFERLKSGLEPFIREVKLTNVTSGTVISAYENPEFEDVTADEEEKYVVEVIDEKGVSKTHTVYSMSDAMHIMVECMDAASVKIYDGKTNALLKSMG